MDGRMGGWVIHSFYFFPCLALSVKNKKEDQGDGDLFIYFCSCISRLRDILHESFFFFPPST